MRLLNNKFFFKHKILIQIEIHCEYRKKKTSLLCILKGLMQVLLLHSSFLSIVLRINKKEKTLFACSGTLLFIYEI